MADRGGGVSASDYQVSMCNWCPMDVTLCQEDVNECIEEMGHPAEEANMWMGND